MIKEMVEAQFDFVRKVIESADKHACTFKNVRLFKFGLFYVSPGKIRLYKKYNDKKTKNRDIIIGDSDKDQNNDTFNHSRSSTGTITKENIESLRDTYLQKGSLLSRGSTRKRT